MKRLSLMGKIILWVFLIFPSFSLADCILDQNYAPPINDEPVIFGPQSWGNFFQAQTFTVGISGVLSKVEVWLGRSQGNTNFNLDIIPTTPCIGCGGYSVPTLPSIATISRPISEIPKQSYTWLSFDLSEFNIPVKSGDILAIGLSSEDSSAKWAGTWNPKYPYGIIFATGLNSDWPFGNIGGSRCGF